MKSHKQLPSLPPPPFQRTARAGFVPASLDQVQVGPGRPNVSGVSPREGTGREGKGRDTEAQGQRGLGVSRRVGAAGPGGCLRFRGGPLPGEGGWEGNCSSHHADVSKQAGARSPWNEGGHQRQEAAGLGRMDWGGRRGGAGGKVVWIVGKGAQLEVTPVC